MFLTLHVHFMYMLHTAVLLCCTLIVQMLCTLKNTVFSGFLKNDINFIKIPHFPQKSMNFTLIYHAPTMFYQFDVICQFQNTLICKIHVYMKIFNFKVMNHPITLKFQNM